MPAKNRFLEDVHAPCKLWVTFLPGMMQDQKKANNAQLDATRKTKTQNYSNSFKS